MELKELVWNRNKRLLQSEEITLKRISKKIKLLCNNGANLQSILSLVDSQLASVIWSHLPSDLWPHIIVFINKPSDFFNCHLVCQQWNNVLRTEKFWENFCQLYWKNIDVSYKGDHTIAASKYAKLRLLTGGVNNNWFSKVEECFHTKSYQENDKTYYKTTKASVSILWSKTNLGYISIYWYIREDNRQGFSNYYGGERDCLITTKNYIQIPYTYWFDAIMDDQCPLTVEAVTWNENNEQWVEEEAFKKIRLMLGYERWETLCQDIVVVGVGEIGKDKWEKGTYSGLMQYCWNNDVEMKKILGNISGHSGNENPRYEDVKKRTKRLEDVLELPLLSKHWDKKKRRKFGFK